MCQQVTGLLCPSVVREFEPWALDLEARGVETLEEEVVAIRARERRRKEILERVEIITCSMQEYTDSYMTISSLLICLRLDGKRKEAGRVTGRFMDNKPLLALSMLHELLLNEGLIFSIPQDTRLVSKEGEGMYLLYQGRWFFKEGDESLSNVLCLGLRAAQTF